MVDENEIVDRKNFDNDLLYRNVTTAQLEWVERAEYAAVTGLELEIPGYLFAYQDPEHPQALIITPVNDLAYADPTDTDKVLLITPGAPVAEVEDTTQLVVREA